GGRRPPGAAGSGGRGRARTARGRPASWSTRRPASSKGPVAGPAEAGVTIVATAITRNASVIRLMEPSCALSLARSLVDDEGRDRIVLQLRAPVEKRQLDEEGQPHHDPTGLLDQLEGRGHRAAGGDEVVHAHHPLTP